jgi:glycosyltransferase involved in cell wall biosynthesis/peptidoglycan/xylan/chitin deacetylase (PgdA/CDA1 family)
MCYLKDVLPLRIGMLMDHPSPHMVAFLDAIAERKDCTATVFYCGQSAPERGWGAPVGNLPHRFLNGITVWGGFRINLGLISLLKRTRVDAWIVNTVYSSPSTLYSAMWLARTKIPWVYMNEPPRPRNKLASTLKSFPLDYVLKGANGVIGMGERAASIYRALLPDNRPVTSIPYYVNLNEFLRLPVSAVPTDGKPLNFVVSSQMIHRKGIDILLKACQQVKEMSWLLTLVGDGPLRPALEREFRCHFSHDRVIFSGGIPYGRRREAFMGHNVFLFPSRWDGWGMVVPEALAAGLPVVATDQVISAHEFIKNGVNGFIIPSENPSALADKMTYFIRHPETIFPMALEARKGLGNYRSEVGAEKLVQFLNEVVTSTKRPHGNADQRIIGKPLNWKTLTSSKSSTEFISKQIRQHAKKAVILTGNSLRINPKPKGNRVLVYHLVLNEDRRLFEDHIRFLKDNFVVTSVSEVLRTASEAKDKNEYCAAITFDDGFRILMTDCLEVLEKNGVKASFYIPTSFVELSCDPERAAKFSLRSHYYNLPLEPMRPEDLKLLVDHGHEVGSHGREHISLNMFSHQAAELELKKSKTLISKWTDKEPEGFAYPYGYVQSSVGQPAEWVQAAGYKYAVTLKRGIVQRSSNPFLLPRDHAEGCWSVRDLSFFLLS